MRTKKKKKPILLLSGTDRGIEQIGFWLQLNFFKEKVFLPSLFVIENDLVAFRDQLILLPWRSGRYLSKGKRLAEQKRRLKLFKSFGGRYFSSIVLSAFDKEFYELVTQEFEIIAIHDHYFLGQLAALCAQTLSSDGQQVKVDRENFKWNDFLLANHLNFMSRLPKRSIVQLDRNVDKSKLILSGSELNRWTTTQSRSKKLKLNYGDPLDLIENREEFLGWYKNSVCGNYLQDLLALLGNAVRTR